ncbi:hypothetical protein QYM36_005709 [Artemia franciscana]|uniref:Mediator of RNA polymerase II transcription subunit 19 n=1 Tax=Artemia franciscana TaxID=6661 RepID=A0AA88IC44_ARTSF|nr:hypothetical protein QYM36_005709 [Artemia franciscana]
MLLHLQPYDLSIKYRPGTENLIPNTLSQIHLETKETLFHTKVEYYVHLVLKLLPISQEKLSELRQETIEDPLPRILRKMVEEGWAKKVPSPVAKFWSVKSNLSVVDDIIMKDYYLVIPLSLHVIKLKSIHAENSLTGAANLMAFNNLEHAYNKFSGKKVKDALSSFLPTLPGAIDMPGDKDNR